MPRHVDLLARALPLWLVFIAACRTSAATPQPAARPVDPIEDLTAWVDPFIGTADGDSPDPPHGDKGGAVFPGATLPFGMIQWSPDTGPGSEFSYHHADRKIKGFTVSHISGPGCPALLDFPFLPTTTAMSQTPVGHREATWLDFSHADERATPGHYAVRSTSGVSVELTASTRAGHARMTFPKGAIRGLLIEAGKTAGTVTEGDMHVISPHRVVGSLSSAGFCWKQPTATYKVHMAVQFDQAISASTWYGDGIWKVGAKDAQGASNGLHLQFARNQDRPLHAVVAISYVSVENALLNLEASLKESNFDRVRAQAQTTWNQYLNRIKVQGASQVDKRIFYTALYHSLLHPNVFSDVNGQFMGLDGKVHVAEGYTHYANFSGWDIYRTWIQLAALLAPNEARDLMRSFVVSAQQCGGFPRWTLASDETGVMVGDPGALIVANAHAFGVRGFDEQAALALMNRASTNQGTACNNHVVRPGQALYNALGYLPSDAAEVTGAGATSSTLEYAAADYAIAQFAKALGDGSTAARMLKSSGNWRNVFNPATRYVQPRARNGLWQKDFTPTARPTFIEGNAAQYTFFVPHDVPGLVAALGGPEAAADRLDLLFTQLNSGLSQPYFYIGNEPQFGTPWHYNHLGRPWKTQEVVHRIITRTFTDKPGGLPGNDDLGATSSWFVWASLGLYPDLPGVARLAVNTPRFPRVTVELPNNKRLVITATDVGAERRYVQELFFNGGAQKKPWVALADIVQGGELTFVVGGTPSPTWGTTGSE